MRRALTAALVGVAVALPVHAQMGNTDVLNPNLATKEEMVTVPHVDDAFADAIIAARPFLSPTAFNAVVAPRVTDEAQRDELYTRLFLPINLNTASDDEILMVPGIGARFLREFKEYREYANLAVWRREMGKYVDDAEVARMEKYVFVPIDLNSASDEDILSLPGIGARMLREFKEYRPYTNIEQFRREMGKYVDENEVARMERYVVIR